MNKPAFILMYFLCISAVFIFNGCKNGSEGHRQATNIDSVKERMITVNKTMVNNESARITEFIHRHDWKLDSTGTGLRYFIYKTGKGNSPKENEKVGVTYKLFLLDGSLIYESKKDEFTLGRDETARGLEEALMMMQPGAKAKLIVPKYLGYGMTGDGDKIPGNSTLVYDVELTEIIKSN